MRLELTADEAMDRINTAAAHAWMVRTFLKHAPEFEEDPERMEVPRQIFDFVRALEQHHVKRDAAGFLNKARRKLHRLASASEWFSANVKAISAHTNFHQAALSLAGCVMAVREALAAVPKSAFDAVSAEPEVEAEAEFDVPDLPDDF